MLQLFHYETLLYCNVITLYLVYVVYYYNYSYNFFLYCKQYLLLEHSKNFLFRLLFSSPIIYLSIINFFFSNDCFN